MEGNLGRHDIQPDTKAEILPVNQTAQFEPVQSHAERKGPTLAQKAAQIGILTFGILATYAGSQYPPIAEALARLSPTDPQGGLVEPTRTIVPTYTSEPLPTSTARPPRPTRTPTAEPTMTNTPEPTATPTLTEADVTATQQASVEATATAEAAEHESGTSYCVKPEWCFENNLTIAPEMQSIAYRETMRPIVYGEGNRDFFVAHGVPFDQGEDAVFAFLMNAGPLGPIGEQRFLWPSQADESATFMAMKSNGGRADIAIDFANTAYLVLPPTGWTDDVKEYLWTLNVPGKTDPNNPPEITPYKNSYAENIGSNGLYITVAGIDPTTHNIVLGYGNRSEPNSRTAQYVPGGYSGDFDPEKDPKRASLAITNFASVFAFPLNGDPECILPGNYCEIPKEPKTIFFSPNN